MVAPDRDIPKDFETREAAAVLAVQAAMKDHTDIGTAWTGGSTDGKITALQDTTKKAIVKGASVAVAAENLAELRAGARSYAGKARPDSERGREPNRRALVEQYRSELLALTDASGEDEITTVLNDMLTPDELLPHRRSVGTAIAKLHLACSGVETTKLDDRMPALNPLMILAVDTTLQRLNPGWTPSRPRRRERPAAGTARVPTQPERRGPSLLRPPGSGSKF